MKARELLGKAATPDDFDRVVTVDDDFVDESGRLVFAFRKEVIPLAAREAGRAAWGDVETLADPSVTRRAAAGAPDVEAFRRFPRFRDAVEVIPETSTTARVKFNDGRVLRQPMSNPVLSYLAGFGVDRFSKTARPNLLTNRYRDRWTRSLPFFRAVDEVLARELPHTHALHRERCALHPSWTIAGTALSTVTVNVDYESRYHVDTGDFRDGYSVLTVLEAGRYDGGLYVMPLHRVAVDVREGDALLCQSHVDLHGNTAIVKRTEDAKRISFVCYLKHALGDAVNRADPWET